MERVWILAAPSWPRHWVGGLLSGPHYFHLFRENHGNIHLLQPLTELSRWVWVLGVVCDSISRKMDAFRGHPNRVRWEASSEVNLQSYYRQRSPQRTGFIRANPRITQLRTEKNQHNTRNCWPDPMTQKWTKRMVLLWQYPGDVAKEADGEPVHWLH